MEPNGQLKVDEFLRVAGYDDIYAIGDCCNSKDIKLAYAAGEQACHVTRNLLNKDAGKPEAPWKEGASIRIFSFLFV